MDNTKKEELKHFLIDYIKEITPQSKTSKNQFVCPFCSSGNGKHQTGAFTFYPETNTYYCFSCGSSGDIFTLYGKLNKIDDFSTILSELADKYKVYVPSSYTPPSRSETFKTTSSASNTTQKNYTDFFKIAEQHLHETNYLTNRGISLEIQQKYHCGYVANFMYKNNQTTSAVIIPTSENSFMWRSTTENLKRKRGSAHILNSAALKNDYCFVVEGEIDCMSLDECGFHCIGLGSSSNTQKVFDYDTSHVTLIIAMDNDKAGLKATRTLEQLCIEYRTPYITAPANVWSDYKDANELLIKDKDKLKENLSKLVLQATNLNRDDFIKNAEALASVPNQWKSMLKRNPSDNSVKNTLKNLYLILNNDNKYKNQIEFNELTQMRSFMRKNWDDVTESRLKFYLEQEYDIISSIENINHVCNIIADEHAYHPIKEYLEQLQWDGCQRISTVFRDFLGATNNIYTQSVAVVTFVGAVARLYKPGIKYDTCTVLVGKQGTGKSKFISKIAVNPDWFTDGVTTFDGKDFYESIQGKWIIELGEGTAFQKSIKERSKQAIASQQDFYRKPYGRNPEIRKRQCVFLGTTNNYDFLKDETGDRRYYPIDVNIQRATKSIDKDLTDNYIAQLWAEALCLFEGNQSIYIQDSGVLALAEQEQRKHFDESPLQSDIYNFLEIPITKDWYNASIEVRRIHIRAYQNGEEHSGAYKRDKVSVKEIACELYGYEINQPIERKFSLEIARTLTALGWNKTGKAERISPYGVVKTYYYI